MPGQDTTAFERPVTRSQTKKPVQTSGNIILESQVHTYNHSGSTAFEYTTLYSPQNCSNNEEFWSTGVNDDNIKFFNNIDNSNFHDHSKKGSSSSIYNNSSTSKSNTYYNNNYSNDSSRTSFKNSRRIPDWSPETPEYTPDFQSEYGFDDVFDKAFGTALGSDTDQSNKSSSHDSPLSPITPYSSNEIDIDHDNDRNNDNESYIDIESEDMEIDIESISPLQTQSIQKIDDDLDQDIEDLLNLDSESSSEADDEDKITTKPFTTGKCTIEGIVVDKSDLSRSMIAAGHREEPIIIDDTPDTPSFLTGTGHQQEPIVIDDVPDVSKSVPIIDSQKESQDLFKLEDLIRLDSESVTDPYSLAESKQPITREILISIKKRLDLEDTEQAMFWCLCTVAFHSLARVNELVTNIKSKILRRIEVNQVKAPKVYIVPYACIRIPNKKNKQAKIRHLVIFPSHDDICPLTALSNYCRIRTQEGYASDSDPFFCLKGGEAATRDWFDQKLRPLLAKGEPLKYSFRAGGVLELVAQGRTKPDIRCMGRWNFNNFEDYLNDHPSVLLAFISTSISNAYVYGDSAMIS